MKKLILLFIVLCMCTSGLAFAYADVQDGDVSDAVEQLSQFNIINGYTDGTFRPNNSITRAEFSKVICKTILCDTESDEENPFADVGDGYWAKEYIQTAKRFKIVNGVTETLFCPNDNVTYEQAIKMVVVSLGYMEEAESAGGYPEGYITVAQELMLLDDVEYRTNDFATRGNIALIIRNALFAQYYILTETDGVVTRELSQDNLFERHFFAIGE